jgi:hypothetical protein
MMDEQMGLYQGDYVETMKLMSMNVNYAKSLNLNVELDVKTGLKAMEYSIWTCDIDMLMKSYHRLSDDDDDDIALADVAHICAVDVVVAMIPKDWQKDLPLS